MKALLSKILSSKTFFLILVVMFIFGGAWTGKILSNSLASYGAQQGIVCSARILIKGRRTNAHQTLKNIEKCISVEFRKDWLRYIPAREEEK